MKNVVGFHYSMSKFKFAFPKKVLENILSRLHVGVYTFSSYRWRFTILVYWFENTSLLKLFCFASTYFTTNEKRNCFYTSNFFSRTIFSNAVTYMTRTIFFLSCNLIWLFRQNYHIIAEVCLPGIMSGNYPLSKQKIEIQHSITISIVFFFLFFVFFLFFFVKKQISVV